MPEHEEAICSGSILEYEMTIDDHLHIVIRCVLAEVWCDVCLERWGFPIRSIISLLLLGTPSRFGFKKPLTGLTFEGKDMNLGSENQEIPETGLKSTDITLPRGRKAWKIVASCMVALSIGWLSFYVISKPGSQIVSSSKTQIIPFGPEIVTANAIQNATKDLGHVIYWAGVDSTKQYELTILKNGAVYIRYLPDGVKAGSKKPFSTVVTYSDSKGFEHVQTLANNVGAISIKDTGGAFVAAESNESLNAYFAYSNYPIQVEVYTPIPGKAWTLIQSGQIQIFKK